MADVQDVINACKMLESLLSERFNAQGHGLGQKVDSVVDQLGPLQYCGLKHIVYIRNKVIHAPGYTAEEAPEHFLPACQMLATQLSATSAEAESMPTTCAEYAAYYCKQLQQQGFAPSTDEDGDISFDYDGNSYMVLIDDDIKYFELIIEGSFIVDNEQSRQLALAVANIQNENSSLAKVYVNEEFVDASVMMTFESTPHFHSVFARRLKDARGAIQAFEDAMSNDDRQQEVNA